MIIYQKGDMFGPNVPILTMMAVSWGTGRHNNISLVSI